MKKFLALLITGLLFAGILSACAQPEPKEVTTTTTYFPTTTITNEAVVAGTVTFSGEAKLISYSQRTYHVLVVKTSKDTTMSFYSSNDKLVSKLKKGNEVEVLYNPQYPHTYSFNKEYVDDNGFTRYGSKSENWYWLKGIKIIEK